jgi:hypothetical protein
MTKCLTVSLFLLYAKSKGTVQKVEKENIICALSMYSKQKEVDHQQLISFFPN